MRVFVLAATLMVGMAGAASAQLPADNPPDKIRRLVIYGNDPCPTGEGGEVVVCARRPETERFRIPKNLRNDEGDAEAQSWAARAESVDSLGKTGIDSCSTTGPGGQTGCLKQSIDNARQDSAVKAEAVPK